MTIYLWGWFEVALRVRSGDVATDLQRPLDFQCYWLAQDLGRAAYHALFRGVPPFLFGALVFDVLIPGDPLVWLAFPASVTLAVVTSFAFRFLFNLVAFWLLDYRGAGVLAMVASTFFSGQIVPIAFFPDWLAHGRVGASVRRDGAGADRDLARPRREPRARRPLGVAGLLGGALLLLGQSSSSAPGCESW